MSKVIAKTHTITDLNPTGYTGNSGLSTNSANFQYGQNSTTNTSTSSRARFYPSSTNTAGYLYYTFTIPTIPSDATITSVTAAFRANLSNTSGISGNGQLYANTTAKGSATSVSSSSSTVYNITNTGTWTVSEISNLRLRISATRTSSGGGGGGSTRYLYFYGADITITYTVDETVYEINVTSTDGHGTVSPISGEADAGSDYALTFTHETAGTKPYQVLDNNVDVTSQLVEVSGQASSYTVTTASGASYGFNQSGDSWVSTNTGVNSSAAVSIITLTIRNNATVTIDATASSEADYDYGYLSEIGSTFSTSASTESSYKWRGAGTDSGTVNYGTLTPGTYQIYAKYYKDTYTASNNDTFTFKVNISETIATEGSFAYTISNVQADHNIEVFFNIPITHNISGTVDSHLAISPSLPQDVSEGSDFNLTITPSLPGTITITDNNVITATYVIDPDNINNIIYTITNVLDDHVLNISFTEASKYTISGTIDSSLSISPTLPLEKYALADTVLTITPSAAGVIKVYDNGIQVASYAISRDSIQSVDFYIYNISESHVLNITFEAAKQLTVSGTAHSSLSIRPSLPQTLYTGDDLALIITPSNAGIIKVYDNDVEAAVYEIIASDVSAVTYSLLAVSESHILNITYEALPTFTIDATVVASEISISPTLPVTKYLGESQTLTIASSTSGTITVIDNSQEVAIHYITPEDVHSVTYTLSNIAANHDIEVKFSELPEYTATATLSGSGNLSSTTQTDYAGRDVTFTVTDVPSSNILIILNNGENVSKQAIKSGTTYTYTFTLLRNSTVQFTSKIPSSVNVTATIDEFGTINPATTTVQEGDEYTLQITPEDFQSTATPPISVSDNYEEVVDELVARKDSATPVFSTSSNTNTSIQSGSSYLAYCNGYTAENPATQGTSSNAYASNGNTGYATYSFNVSSIPSDATIISVSCKVYGHRESSTVSSTYVARAQLYADTTAKGSYLELPSTSNTLSSISDCGTWTRSEVDNIKLRFTVGYYGGLLLGVSLTIEYELDQTRYYYTTTVYEEKTINVKYKPDFYVKVKNQWKGRTLTSMLPKIGGLRKHVKKLYVKIGGVWKSVD